MRRGEVRVAEVFGPTVQGEGAMAGLTTYFVRVGGCDYRCSWCDSMHAVLPQYREQWRVMSPAAIVDRLRALGADHGAWVTLSGGNPTLHDLTDLVSALRADGLRIAMETQGTLWKPWAQWLDHVCFSPKGPSSGNVTPWATLWDNLKAALDASRPSVAVKVVVFDEHDYEYARDTFRNIRATRAYERVVGRLFLSVGNAEVSPSEPISATRARLCDAFASLSGRVAADPDMRDIRVLPQLHALAWGNALAV